MLSTFTVYYVYYLLYTVSILVLFILLLELVSNYSVRDYSQALDTMYPCFQSTINMTNVTMAQFNHTQELRKFGTCAGGWQADELERGSAWLNLDFKAEVLVEVEKQILPDHRM